MRNIPNIQALKINYFCPFPLTLSNSFFRNVIGTVFIALLLSMPAHSQSNAVGSMFWDMLNNNQIENASEFINKAIADNPDNFTYYLLRANVCLKANNPKQALLDVEKYLTEFPPSCDACLLKGKALMALERYKEAIVSFTTASDYSEGMTDKQYCYLLIGKAYNLEGNYQLAHEKLLKAKAIFSFNNEYLSNIGLAQLNLNLVEETEATKSLLLEMYPNEANTFSFLFEYYQRKSNYSEALNALNKKLDLTTGSSKDYEVLGKLAKINKDTLSMIRATEWKIKFESENYLPYMNLALLYSSIANYSKAIICINVAIRLNGEDPICYKIKGDIYVHTELKSQACDYYFLALKKGYQSDTGSDLLQSYIKNCEE
jgi:tetratricopeptide (TPR) repeat protein